MWRDWFFWFLLGVLAFITYDTVVCNAAYANMFIHYLKGL